MTRKASFAALSWLLAGCAGIPPSSAPPTPGALPAAAARAYHENIDLEGRLSVRYQKNGQEEAVHGNFNWVQTPGRTLITLRSPVGQTLAIIDVTPGLSTLRQNGQAPRSAADPDALASQALGWPLPIAGLRNWLQGFALDAQGQRFIATPTAAAAVTTRDGWRIRYVSWQEGGLASASQPKRIDLERSTQQAGPVALRIVLDTWQPH